MRDATEEERRSTREYIDSISKSYKDYIREWLDSFNTNSATCCFTAIQQLKEGINE